MEKNNSDRLNHFEQKGTYFSPVKYSDGFDQRVARQQLCNKVKHATIEEAVFSVSAVTSQQWIVIT
jgi:hypothetical protein